MKPLLDGSRRVNFTNMLFVSNARVGWDARYIAPGKFQLKPGCSARIRIDLRLNRLTRLNHDSAPCEILKVIASDIVRYNFRANSLGRFAPFENVDSHGVFPFFDRNLGC
jgi:hypothetical protein